MAQSVVITGAGLICALGDSPARLHEALAAGQDGFAPVSLFSTEGMGCRHAAEVRGFSAKTYLGNRNLRPLDRTGQLAAVAAELALADSGWSMEMRKAHDVGLVLGTMFCSVKTIAEFDRRALKEGPEYASPLDFANTVISAAAGQVAIWHQLRGVNSTVAAGAASGLQAIGTAAQLIRSGRAGAILAGGADELCFESYYGFLRAGVLCGSGADGPEFPVPFDARRNGFAAGEGAAFVMLEDEEAAAARGARVLGRVVGFGCGYDARRGLGNGGRDAIADAVRTAMREARVSAAQIDCVSASANGSPIQDAREARALRAILGGRAREVPVTAIKSMTGETLGASGAIQAVAMLEARRQGALPPIARLETSEEDFGLDLLRSAPRALEPRHALITAVAREGNCSVLVLDLAGRAN